MKDFKIKNRISNSKEEKKEIILEKYVNILKFLRLKTKKIFPLSKNEELLYLHQEKEISITPLNENDFFESIGNIILLFTYPKSDINNLEKSLKKLILNNPSKNLFSRTLISQHFSDRFNNYSFSNNFNSWSNIGVCSPNEKSLKDIINYIEIYIFNFSNDYIGISFNLFLSDTFVNYLNTAYKKTTGFNTNKYHFYNYKKKRRIGTTIYSPEIIRKQEVENILIEIKIRSFNFLKKYITITNIPSTAPISIDIYCSNIFDFNSRFYSSYDCFLSKDDIHHNLNIIYEENSNQEFIKKDFILELYSRSKTNRSSRLILLNNENISKKVFIITSELINIFIQKLCIELSYELNNLISRERTLIEKNYDKSEKKFNNIYDSLYKKIFKYEMIFNEIVSSNNTYIDGFIDDSIKKYFDNFHGYYQKLLKKHQIIEKASNDKMLISNYKSTRNLAVISIIIAILTLIISVFFEYRQKFPDYSNQIEQINNNFHIIYNQLDSINKKIDVLNNE